MDKSIKKIEHFEKFGSILELDRIAILLKKMGDPQKDLKCIHIAGTNGKGSTSRFVYQVLREQGYSVGIYSSPFLEVFNERIEVDGQYILDEELEKVLEETTKLGFEIEAENLPVPTEFDIVTASAFRYFSNKKVDFVVLEVGLGGRADSTNIIEAPLVSAITSISLDHTDRLGESLEEIAYEKAGIIKKEIPVIIGSLPKEAYQVISKVAKEKNARLIPSYRREHCGGNRQLVKEESNIFGSKFTVDNNYFEISMVGEHQIDNALVALGILDIVEEAGYEISREAYFRGMKKAFNKGRMELLEKGNSTVILDGAHNQAGMKAFASTVIENFSNREEKIKIVFGVLEDKDIEAMCKELIGLKEVVDFDLVLSEPNNPRKLEAEKTKEYIGRIWLKLYIYF